MKIKLKVWDDEQKVFLPSDDEDIYWNCTDGTLMARLDDNNGDWRELIIILFTGLTLGEINVYNGDICEIQHDEPFGKIPMHFKGEVKQIEGCWYVDNGTMAFLLWQEIVEWKVIGNIYQS